jgi:MFS family permease
VWRVTARSRSIGIVVLAVAILFATNGFILSGLTVFDSRILADLHISNSTLRLRDTITVLTLGLSVPFVGHLIDRIDARPVLICGLLLMLVGFLGYYGVRALWQIYALHVLFGISQATSGVVTCVYLVSIWTRAHRGLALGLVIGGSSLGNAVVPAVNAALLHHVPWRVAVLSGAGIAAALIPLVLVVVRKPPGTAAFQAALGAHAGDPVDRELLRNALRSRSFMVLAATAATTVLCVLALATNLALFGAPSAASPAGSGPALLFGLFGTAVVAQVASGIAADHIRTATIHVAAVAVMLAGALLLALAPSAALAAVALFGFGWGANSSMLQIRPSLRFAGPTLGRVLSLLALSETLGGSVGPFVAGYISDRAGSFAPAFLAVAAILAIPVVLTAVFRFRDAPVGG